ncbi:MAG TPA: diaminopimelate epimerase [Bryobacteraceae bacterium]
MNDFLLTWWPDAPHDPAIAVAICNRFTGIGADGWMLVDPTPGDGFDATIRLFNSDGSEPELSGNGTRCAAALLFERGHAGEAIRIRTGAGVKHLRVTSREGSCYQFEMNMGVPRITALREMIPLASGPREATIINVGNPQCAYIVDNFDFDWRAAGVETERHPRFPNRTNVSFVKPAGTQSIEVRFFERGAGETMSSGTGSTGAAVTAIARKLAISPVTVITPAGNLVLDWNDPQSPVYLVGPAQIIADGTYRHEIITQA